MKRLIVALDLFSFAEMQTIVSSLGDAVSAYKIGHQLFTSEGPKTIAYLKAQGKVVFLDLKLHEIPNSVAQAVHAAGKLGVNLVSVHASGGRKMMAAAVAVANPYPVVFERFVRQSMQSCRIINLNATSFGATRSFGKNWRVDGFSGGSVRLNKKLNDPVNLSSVAK